MKKKFKITASILSLAMGLTVFAGCGMEPGGNYGGSASGDGSMGNMPTVPGPEAPGDSAGNEFPTSPDLASPEFGFGTDGETGNYQYTSVQELDYYETATQPDSYFSLDRNTAGYSLMRAQINSGRKISPDSVRIEELVNYFSYDYPAPAEGEGLKATAYLSDCPWNSEHSLVTVGLKSEERVVTQSKNNYVFLIDVSGSMSANVEGLKGQTCLDLVKYGIDKLLDGLNENDAVSIVKYASGEETVLEPTLATQEGKTQIRKAVKGLQASGATYGSGGLALAYKNAQKYYSADGNNRVILMTDGDFNVGIRKESDLKEFIQEKAKSGIYLSVLGVGMGNMRDDFMQTLALNGNGNYAYIDSPREAQKVLCEELNGLLTTVAKDAKAGVTFSQDTVVKYRLIGYDMKTMSKDDFDNVDKDAGEIGSNLCVTALYEVELAKDVEENAKLADVTVRFKLPDGSNKEIVSTLVNEKSATEDGLFVSCVAEFGLVLRQSKYKGNATIASVLDRMKDLANYLDNDIYKTEFKELVQKAQQSNYYN